MMRCDVDGEGLRFARKGAALTRQSRAACSECTALDCFALLAERLFLLVAIVLFPMLAHAQMPGGGNAPIEITADQLEVQQDNQLAIFSGNVVAIQGEMTMKSAVMNVYYQQNGSGDNEIHKIDARGKVDFTGKEEKARGNTALFMVNEEKLYLTGNVELQREGNILRGQKLEYNTKTGRSILTGGATAKEINDGKGGTRVKGVFLPKSK